MASSPKDGGGWDDWADGGDEDVAVTADEDEGSSGPPAVYKEVALSSTRPATPPRAQPVAVFKKSLVSSPPSSSGFGSTSSFGALGASGGSGSMGAASSAAGGGGGGSSLGTSLGAFTSALGSGISSLKSGGTSLAGAGGMGSLGGGRPGAGACANLPATLCRKRVAGGAAMLLLFVYLMFVSSKSDSGVPQSKIIEAIKFTAGNVKELQAAVSKLGDDVGELSTTAEAAQRAAAKAAADARSSTSAEADAAERLAALERTAKAQADTLAAMAVQLEALESAGAGGGGAAASAALSAASSGASSKAAGALSDAVLLLEERLDDLSKRLEAHDSAASVDAAPAGGGKGAAADAAAAELAAQLKEMRASDAGLRKDVTALKGQLSSLRGVAEAAGEAAAAATSEAAELRAQLAALQAAPAAAAADGGEKAPDESVISAPAPAKPGSGGGGSGSWLSSFLGGTSTEAASDANSTGLSTEDNENTGDDGNKTAPVEGAVPAVDGGDDALLTAGSFKTPGPSGRLRGATPSKPADDETESVGGGMSQHEPAPRTGTRPKRGQAAVAGTAPQLSRANSDAGEGGVAPTRDGAAADEKEPAPPAARSRFNRAGAGSGTAADAEDGTKRAGVAAAGSGANAVAASPAAKVVMRGAAAPEGGVFSAEDVDKLTAPGEDEEEAPAEDEEEAAADEQQDEDKSLTGARQQRPVAPAGRNTPASPPAAGSAPRRQAPTPNAATAAERVAGGPPLGRTRGGAAAGKPASGLQGGAGARPQRATGKKDENLEDLTPPNAGSASSAGGGDQVEGTDIEGVGDGEPYNGA